MVSIAVLQAVDPGSFPGRRRIIFWLLESFLPASVARGRSIICFFPRREGGGGHHLKLIMIIWISLGFFGHLWVSLGIFGFLWVPLGSFGFLWVPLVSFGLGSLGFLRVLT